MEKSLIRFSKFLSLVLRHRPALIGLVLDEAGWAEVDELLKKMQARGMQVDRGLLDRVVDENDKQRFSYNDDRTRIRANQGHTLPVDLNLEPRTPPERLYHGTASDRVSKIFQDGLRKGRRHAVHLSTDLETAEKVGSRHGCPVILTILSGQMQQDGYTFTCSENGVWLTDYVPPKYIQELP